ncbi:MAG: hypothetical protein U0794_18500 [Isosphaeraceae bacterium]
MLSKQSNLTPSLIRQGLQAGARPLNGSTAGTWDQQGGYGLVDASAALAAIDVLRVLSVTPANGSTLTTAPNQLIFTFNKPVDINTVNLDDLVFTAFPNTLTGVPVVTAVRGVDSQTTPTQIAFTFAYSAAANQLANGRFAYTLNSMTSAGSNPQQLQQFSGSFTLTDSTSPRVTNTSINGRIVKVAFSEQMAPSSINVWTVYVVREVSPGNYINLNLDPKVTVSYDAATQTATADYSDLLQSQLPSGKYYLIVKAGNALPGGGFDVGVTDLAGNKLDGEFTGVFPSGNGNPNGPSANEDFVQNIGNVTLRAPQVTSLVLQPAFDTGIKNDENTYTSPATFVGQVTANFPGSVSGVTVLAQFNSLHGGTLNLGTNGRGWTGTYDVRVTTNPDGSFTIPSPFLPEGFTTVRLVVIAQPDNPPEAGLSSQFDHVFRIDQSKPQIVKAALTPQGLTPTGTPLPIGNNNSTNLNSLTTLSLGVQDPNNPPFGALATPTAVYFPALDPTVAANVSNYQLINTDITDPASRDFSRFITSARFVATGSDYVSAPNRTATSDPYYGRIDLAFSQGLPKGHYVFVAHSATAKFTGISDAAGNPLDNSAIAGQGFDDAVDNTNDDARAFVVRFNVQPEPTYIVTVSSNSPNSSGDYLLPRSFYEINPRAGDVAFAPPTVFNVDFSNPLDPTKNYSDALQLIRTANFAGGNPDGDFGSLGIAGLGSSLSGTTGNYSRFNPNGTTVQLVSGPYGANTRLVLTLPTGTVLPADNYRLYLPNAGTNAINDIYGNQLDGEFLGNPTASAVDLNNNPAYEDLLPNGQYRSGMSGDSVSGGAFMAGFIVVPSGNVIYARPDYVEDPLLPSTTPDGSMAKPYSVLAPQAAANALNTPTLNNGDPNGGLNSSVNFLSGFNPTYDRAGIQRFARSAFYAASQLSSRGPVVIVALPALSGNSTFVLQAPSGSDPVANNGSGSVPYNTALVFNPGSTLKLRNASLFVQNQGSSLQTLGGPNPNQTVNFTSYNDDTINGDTNRDGQNTQPRAGDWGGVVFRNFTQANRTSTFPVDVTLTTGPNGGAAVSGSDDALSSINFARISFGGGAVPATQGLRYDEVTLFNSRPSITNSTIIGGPNAGGSQAAISADLDSFREDDLARGMLVRRTTTQQTSINGIWVRPLQTTGTVVATDAVTYPDNPVTLGGVRNYTFDDPLPLLFTSVMNIGLQNVTENFGVTTAVHNRLYIQPGMLLKFQLGAGILVPTAGASMIVGDRTYISRWDALASTDPTNGLPVSTYNPNATGFRPNTVGDARVLFTTALDNNATTAYFDPITGQSTTIVPANDTINSGGVGQPSPGNVPASSRWGYVSYTSGAFGTFDEAELRYGGGNLNIPGGTTGDAGVLNFTGAAGGRFVFIPGQGFVFQVDSYGTRLMVTNNNFYDNADVPMSITPNGLLAADTLNPLSSGHPYFRGNIFQRNAGANGLYVKGTPPGFRQSSNVDVNSLWDSTDLTYIVRETIVMGGGRFGGGGTTPPASSFQPPPAPTVVLTVQSALPGTLLADGSKIPLPGESVIIKLDNNGNAPPTPAQTQSPTLTTENFGGAGFIAGVDNGVDPTTDSTVDVGAYSQMRFLGIGGNQTTGQQRVPVVITSINDNTVGTTVRGVKLFTAIDGNTQAPAAGDGGLIYFGGNMLHNYSVLDPRAGSLIDNADIRYISRIELQGGGLVDYIDLDASNAFDAADNPYSTKGGAFTPLANGQPNPNSYRVQNNTQNALMISNSNLANFSDAGIIQHYGFNAIAGGTRSSISGQATQLFLMNNTIANMPIGVQVIGDPNPDANFPEPQEVIALHNTFYNNPIAFDLRAIAWAPGTPQTRSHIHFQAMNNIFQGSTTAVVQGAGMLDGSQMQYNLFWNNGPVLIQGPGPAMHNPPANRNPVNGDPKFRDAANGNFQLNSDSAAIDASRSELKLFPSAAADAYTSEITTILPVVNQVLDSRAGIRNQTNRTPDFGFLDPNNPPVDQLSLTGSPNRGFVDLWYPTLASDPQGIPGPTTVPGSWIYKPALIPAGTQGVPGGGERDSLGYLRIDNPGKPNVGFGSRPFFDIGAYEYVPLFPPHINDVKANVSDSSSSTGITTLDLYKVNGITGTNKSIQTIQVYVDHNLDPNTVDGSTVLLQASGGDAIFGNNNNPNDKFYNLSGKVSFDPSTNILTINVGAAGLTLQSDMYRLTLVGTGSNVIRDPQGNALDGENTVNGDVNGAQLALPSGDGFPGGNFYNTFIINTTSPSLVPNSFVLDPTSDTNIAGDLVTTDNTPTFTGQVNASLSQISPLQGQTVYLDFSTRGDGVFDRLNVGTAVTDAQGRFAVTVGVDGANTGLVTNGNPLGDSPYTFNSTNLTFSGYGLARVRIVDQSGNTSNLTTDSLNAFAQKGAVTGTIIDTAAPRITSFSPSPNQLLRPDATGSLTFTFTTDKYLDPKSLSASSIIVTRAGADGVLGTTDDVNVPINASSITTSFIAGSTKGAQSVSFSVSGSLVNDQYAVTLKGTGSPLTDIAGNPLAGSYNGTFPTGQDGVAGVDFNPVYVVIATTSKTIYVGGTQYITDFTAALGSRANPYPTITTGLAGAAAGDMVGVLPGVYTESISLKPFVKMFSAASSSTDTSFKLGNAQQTIIRAPAPSFSNTAAVVTVSAVNLPSVNGLDTEISGFSIASPLFIDPATGPIDPNTRAIQVINSNVLIDRNYIIDAQVGIDVRTSGTNAPTPRIMANGIIGNVVGVMLDDSTGSTVSVEQPTIVINNTFAFNTLGVMALNTSSTPLQASLFNNIYWQNTDGTTARGGTAIFSSTANKLVVRNSLFSGNGPNNNSTLDDAINVGNGFSANLKTTPDALGNFTGTAGFVSPRDPRPTADGPARFFLDANFDLTSQSAAVDAALNIVAPGLDFLARGRVDIAGRGFPGTGPADVGAFEYKGSGGLAAGGAFRVATSSLASDGSALANGATLSATDAPKTVTVSFSDAVDASSLNPDDLVLSGDGLSSTSPARATGVSLLNDHTAVFTLTGGARPN